MAQFGYNTDLNARTLAVTTDAYISKALDNVMVENPMFAMLKSKGRFSRQNGGAQLGMAIKYRRADLRKMTDMQSITYSRLNRHVNIAVPMRMYYMEDSFSFQEEFVNTGESNKIDIIGQMMPNLIDDFTNNFPAELLKDGNAAGNTDGVHGLESCLSHSGTVYNGRAGSPNDSYFGQSTALGARGTWNANDNWPNGYGQEAYHYWSPFVWIYDDASWTGSTATWEDACLRLAKQDQLFSTRRGHKRDFGFLNATAYAGMSNKVEAREQIRTDRGKGTQLLLELGIGPTMYYEGVEWTHDRNIPSRDALSSSRIMVGYSLSSKDVQIKHWTPKLIHALNLPFQATTLTTPFILTSILNMCVNPQGVSKIINSASTDSTME